MKRMSRKSGNGQLEFFAAGNGKARKRSDYQPLPSVWEGTDAELLERMLDFYPHRTPKKILDATVNKGRFWVGSTRPVTGLDIDPAHKPDFVGDNRDMPFEDASFDVVVYDPRTSPIRVRTT